MWGSVCDVWGVGCGGVGECEGVGDVGECASVGV